MKFFQGAGLVFFCSAIFLSAPVMVLGQAGSTRPSSDPANLRRLDQQRAQWFRHGRAVAGQESASLRYRAHQQRMLMRAAGRLRSASPQAITENWIPLGPAPTTSDASGTGLQDYDLVSGRATSVAIDPADASGNTVYIGGAYGGVWKSTNAGSASSDPGGVLWIPLTDNQATLAVGAIAIQPQSSNPDPTHSVVLVGTGETNGSSDSYYGLGILRSANAGTDWTLISQDTTGRPFAGLGFSKIAFSTRSPNVVVAAAAAATEGIAEGLETPVAVNRGIYDSSDAGISWTYASIMDGASATDPASVTSVAYNAAAGQFFAAISLHGFYSSSDGLHWVRLLNQPPALNSAACPAHAASPSSCPLYRGEISVVPGRNEMYVWFVDAGNVNGHIWQSTNGGAAWIQLDDDGIVNCGDVLGGCGTSQGSYALALAAVADGTATDLYAGAVNLYKCRLTNASSTCSGTGPDTFLNLTHVYGCSSIAHVHPNQHGIASLLVNGNAEDVLYFANDGGIYRALDGYSGLTTGSCGGSNQFSSLNQTLGSITQFVSFAQSSTDPHVIFGGAGGDGAPGTATAEGSSLWMNVNAGDGGPTAISPSDEHDWFASTPPDSVSGINIFSCASGIGCHTDDFVNHQIVSSATLDRDAGGFYPAYMFDPQNSSELLVGTCRVWRGTAAGGGFAVLSNNFESGGDAICDGNETNMVRTMAAGGSLDRNGFSNTIYAGTDGTGPLLTGSPSGGHLWVSTDVADGILTWADRTGAINPGNFPISGIAVDTSVSSGMTAYVTVMGFHVPHVWQTRDGGASWTNFTANLPDAPVDAIVLDPGVPPGTGMIYVGTDVGIFSSSTATASWTEVGPVGGQAGYLPNVPVTAILIFDQGETRRLRASTYGRGIWELNLVTTPEFQMSVAQNPMTAFAGQSAIFSGTITALNGYSSTVNLSCLGGATVAPPNCLIAPRSPLPLSSGTALTVTASGTPGNYLFSLHGIGADANNVTRDLALSLSVVDFNLTTPSPASIAVTPPNDSAPVTFQVTADGAFHGVVDLSCLGLPDGTTCNFTPATMSPTIGNPANVSLTMSTTASTPNGPFSIMIVGATAGGPNKIQAFTLVVNAAANADYSLAISNATLTAPTNTAAVFNGTLTSINGYSLPVNLSCGAGAPASCVAIPSIATPTPSGEPFTVTVSSVSALAYNFNVLAQGTDASNITHAFAVSFSTAAGANPDFTISNASGPQTTAAGTTVQYSLTFTPAGSTAFTSAVTYTCSSAAIPLSSCSFTPGSPIAANSPVTQIGLIVNTTAAIASLRKSKGAWLYGFWLPFPGLLLMSGRYLRRVRGLVLALCIFPILLTIACSAGLRGGGGGEPGTPPGLYVVTVNASEGTVSHSLQATLTVQ